MRFRKINLCIFLFGLVAITVGGFVLHATSGRLLFSEDSAPSQTEVQTGMIASPEQVAYDRALAYLEHKHPQLNPDSPKFDPELVRRVSDLMDVQIKKGVPPAKALTIATYFVFENKNTGEGGGGN